VNEHEQIEPLSLEDDVRTSPAGLERAPYPTEDGNALGDMLGSGRICCCTPCKDAFAQLKLHMLGSGHAPWCLALLVVPT
jgi:hypothetical protein